MTTIVLLLMLSQTLADPPASGLGARQEKLLEQFKAFDARLRQAAETLRSIDPQRSNLLTQAAGRSRSSLIERQLDHVTRLLRDSEKTGAQTDADALARAVKDQEALLVELDGVLAILLSDDQAKLAKEKQEQILRRLQAVKELERDQRDLQSLTDRAKNDADAKRLSDPQGDLADRTKKMEADDPSQGESQKKKDADGGDLKNARESMENAKKSLDDAKRDKAKKEQREALERLAKETEKLAKVLRQMREEERLQSLVSLETRCRKLLDGEKSLQEKIVALDRSSAKERTRADVRMATDLSAVQRALAAEADATLAFVREDNVAVAFDESLVIVRDDMTRIEQRLRDAETGPVVQAMAASNVGMLSEMVSSLQREIAESRERQSEEEQEGGGDDRDQLLDRLAELRLVKSLQVQIEKRTALVAKLAAAGASAKETTETLAQLAERQHRVYEITRELAAREKRR
jgi:hypothetical protein